MTLQDYLGTGDDRVSGRGSWYGAHYAKDWTKGYLKTRRVIKLAQGPLRKWRVNGKGITTRGAKSVTAREVFSITKVTWDYHEAWDWDRDYQACTYAVLLLRSVETVHGRVIVEHTVVGNYDFDDCSTTCSVIKEYRGRGLGRIFLLAAQQLVRKAEPGGELTKAGYANRCSAHRLVVQQAVASGERVPLAVLSDYPELVRRYAKRHIAKRKGSTVRSAATQRKRTG